MECLAPSKPKIMECHNIHHIFEHQALYNALPFERSSRVLPEAVVFQREQPVPAEGSTMSTHSVDGRPVGVNPIPMAREVQR